MTLDCTGCCRACRPPWMRRVDDIYPKYAQDGIVKANMSKLTYYAQTHPQKLDRIGEYLSKRLTRDLKRNSMQLVAISMESMDQLLVACHSHALNLFVESFLKMVEKLLDSSDPEMQCLATTSFVNFSNIEEDTPSYHRRYDYFVSQYSAMCHSNHTSSKQRIRMAGLQGLQGVIRKTVVDELQPDIWAAHHMDKIVPSLLYNMHCDETAQHTDATNKRDSQLNVTASAKEEAERVFRDLVYRAGFNNLKSVFNPVLAHMDGHNLWITSHFPVECFKIIICSVQAQYGHIVVNSLLAHLDTNIKAPAELKSRIADSISETVIIAASSSIGPSVLDVYDRLLRHLRLSVEYKPSNGNEMSSNSRFQESLINTIGEFANHLPDFQKIEILMFIVNKIPGITSNAVGRDEQTNFLLQDILLKTILKVATTYTTVLMSNAFPSSLKNPLLQLSLSAVSFTRLSIQKILHTLIDRRDNSTHIEHIYIAEDLTELDLTLEKPSRQDIHFMKHGGSHILWHVIESCKKENNSEENYNSLYKTVGLLMIEMLAEDTYIDFANFILQLQDVAVRSDELHIENRRYIHTIVICLCFLYSELTSLQKLQHHTSQVIKSRRDKCSYLLPNANVSSQPDYRTRTDVDFNKIPDDCLLNAQIFDSVLQSHGLDTSALSKPISTPETADGMISSKDSDMGSFTNLDMESIEGSPIVKRNASIGVTGSSDHVTVNELKQICVEEVGDNSDRRKQIYSDFLNTPIEKLIERTQSRHELGNKLMAMLADSSSDEEEQHSPQLDSIKHSAMFVY